MGTKASSGSSLDNTAQGRWLTLDDVITRIIEDSKEAKPSIAFAISGGGATGAYEAGVIAAWLQRVQTQHAQHDFLEPRFVMGSSAGALNATTLLVSSVRPNAGSQFGFEVWRGICPRASSFVVGRGRSILVDLATRWVKIPRAAIVAVAALFLFIALLILNPVLASVPLSRFPGVDAIALAISKHPVQFSLAGAVVGIAIVLVAGALFRRAVFRNVALKRTLACVLTASCDPKTHRIPGGLLTRRPEPMQAGSDLVDLWYRAGSGSRLNFIVTATDISADSANLFTLVEPEVFARLAAGGWQVLQLMNPAQLPAGYNGPPDQCGWVHSRDFVTCVVASTSIPGVFPAQRLTLHGIVGTGVAEHDFVDGGVLNNTPIHIAIDAGATHVISFELEPLRRHGTFMYLAEGEPPNLGRNVIQTFETLLANSTRQGIRMASSWNREIQLAGKTAALGKRLVPIFRMAPRRRELNLIDFNGRFHRALSKADPSLEQWLTQGFDDAAQGNSKLFWDATFQPDPS